MFKLFFLCFIFVSSTFGWDSWDPRKDERCPPGTTNPPVMLNDPYDCTRFFKCQGGIAFPIACPRDQHWNAEDNRCDWPYRANCEEKTTSNPEPETLPPIEPTTTEEPITKTTTEASRRNVRFNRRN